MSQPTFEQQAITMIAAEMPISVVFLRTTPGGVGRHTSPVSPKNYGEIEDALRALANPPHVQFLITTDAGIRQLAMSGFVEHDRGFLVMVAGAHILPKKPEELRGWVTMMAAAWAGLVADHIATLNSTGTVAASQKEYLAARFSIDETNLWLLAEESGEVIRGCGKIGRWGYDHVHQVTGESGMRLLEAEVGDFLAIVDIMVARGHFTEEALEAAKQAKLKRLEEWYEAPWTPEDLETVMSKGMTVETVEMSPTTHSAKELIEGGYLAKVVLGDAGLPTPPKGFQWQPIGEPQRLEPEEPRTGAVRFIKPEFLERVRSLAQPVGAIEPATGRPHVVVGVDLPAAPKPWVFVKRLAGYQHKGCLIDEPAQPDGRMRMATDTDQLIWVRLVNNDFRETTPPEAESSGLAGGTTQSYSHVSSPEPTEAWSPVEELPRTPEGYLDWKALDGDLATVKQGVGGLLTVEVTKNGRLRVFTGIVATPITFNITPTP